MTQQPVQQIEQTSKKYKAAMLVGALAVVASMPTCGVGIVLAGGKAGEPSAMSLAFTGLGMLMAMGGISLAVGARMAAWWNHG